MRREGSHLINVESWRRPIPELSGTLVTVREILPCDAGAMFRIVNRPEVRRFYSTPPPTLGDMERFVTLAHERRREGVYQSLSVVSHESGRACGMFQLQRQIGALHVSEWGFCIAPELWNRGVFAESARLVANFAKDNLAVVRLEARVAVRNTRAAAALLKLGAQPEGVLRRALKLGHRYEDQIMWTLLLTSTRNG